MDSLLYLYGHVPVDAREAPVDGIADRAVRLEPLGRFAAVISDVPAEEFSAQAVEARLDDLQWVGRCGVDHERVVAWYVDHGTIIPARLFTLFSSRAALAAEADRSGARVLRLLERFRDAREWDVKIACDLDRFRAHAARHSEDIARLDEQIAQAAPGRRYLLERKRDDEAERSARRVARQRGESLLQELEPLAREARRLQLPAAAGDELPVLLAAALLVDRAQEDALARRLSERRGALENEGFRIDFSGPWAPYRFTGAEEPDGADAEPA